MPVVKIEAAIEMQFNVLAAGAPHKMQRPNRRAEQPAGRVRHEGVLQSALVLAAHVGASITPTPLSTYLEVCCCIARLPELCHTHAILQLF